MRVAIGSIFTECNEFGGLAIGIDAFERFELLRGGEMLALEEGVVGGMLQILHDRAWTPVPLLWASCPPGGPLTAACYAHLKGELLARLRAALPVAGVLLPLHGAASFATASGGSDLEGDLIAEVRALLGPRVPIVATLDLHAHITPQMVAHSDALVAWETYPHSDAYRTGQRGARLLADTLTGRCRPTMAVALVPVITGAVRGSTAGDDPFARLMRTAKAYEARPEVLSTSVILVHPYLDQAQLGSGAVVVTDDDPALATSLACELAEAYWDARCELEPTMWTPAAAIAHSHRRAAQGGDAEGPIVLVETADCCGGGAAGDSVATLSALLAAQRGERLPPQVLVPVVDPEAARACYAAGVGGRPTTSLGHKLDRRWGEPISVTGEVAGLGDGRFVYRGGIFDGVAGDMGPSALLRIGAVTVLISSRGSYDWRDEQWAAMGVDPRESRYVVVKNPMNYRQVYGEVARAVYVLDTPGPTPATVRNLRYARLQRPYFPRDPEAEVTPRLLV